MGCSEKLITHRKSTITKLYSFEVVLLTKFRNVWKRIVDILLVANIAQRPILERSPNTMFIGIFLPTCLIVWLLNYGIMNTFIFYLIKQQIPKAEAQFPWGVPPASPHSLEVKQSPLVAGFEFWFVWHSLLGNDTILNSENDSESKINIPFWNNLCNRICIKRDFHNLQVFVY